MLDVLFATVANIYANGQSHPSFNAAGFTSKDYRIDDYVEQDTEFPVEQAGNIQTE